MGGSQLKQLKTRLKDAGISSKESKKSRRQTPEEKAAKLEEIKNAFNRFDTRHVKPKFDVPGRRIAGTQGKPAQAKSAGIENRRRTLLPELLDRHRSGDFVDRRFGQQNPTLTPEERAQERFTREQQRKVRKASLFNLDDDKGEYGLTHLGQSLSANGSAAQESAADVSDGEEVIHKSKNDIMHEVITKSKAHKADRQRAREEDDDVRLQLDKDMVDLRGLLGVKTRGSQPSARMQAASDVDGIDSALLSELIGPADDDEEVARDHADGGDEYDRFVRELAFEPRVDKASDRLKTDEERALLAKHNLEAAEINRLKRMRGEEAEEASNKRTRPEADDLEDDFFEAGSPRLGRGLGLDEPLAYSIDDDGHAKLAGSLPDATFEASPGIEGDSEPDSDADTSAEGDQIDQGLEIDGLLSESDDGASESASSDVGSLRRLSAKKLGKRKAPADLAFTFECPRTHEDLLEILAETADDAETVGTIIQRIRVRYHPKLGGENKEKMEAFLGVLMDHTLAVTSEHRPDMAVVDAIVPHIFALCTSCPLAASQHCVSRLQLLHRNLLRGLQQGPLNPSARTWPRLPELVLLRLIGLIWSTSDQNHPVSAPAQLLMAQYLGQARLRDRADVASGMALCSLCLQYEAQSKRLCPEAIAFLATALLLLLPHDIRSAELSGAFPVHDAFRAELTGLRLSAKFQAEEMVPLPALLQQNCLEPSHTLAVNALQLIRAFAEIYVSLEAFAELFEPFCAILSRIRKDLMPASTSHALEETLGHLTRMLKLARQTRRPLRMQEHRAVPIASHTPKFDDGGSGSTRNFDPDMQRVESAKLRALHKKEKKGAVRELRRDARFLAEEKAKMQRSRDDDYRRKIGKITSTLQMERGEEKKDARDRKRRWKH